MGSTSYPLAQTHSIANDFSGRAFFIHNAVYLIAITVKIVGQMLVIAAKKEPEL